MKKITDDINDSIKTLYLEKNLSGAEIARMLNVSPSTVLRRLKKMNVDVIRCPHAGIFNIDEVVHLYKSGVLIYEIADKFKSSQETISKILKEQGIEIFHGGLPKFDYTIFDSIDTEEKAYWLGFIYADGYIAKLNPDKKLNYAFSIGLGIVDIDHLRKFNKFVSFKGENIRINRKEKNSKICEICRWDISNEHLWNTLNSYGCTPKKTFTLEFPKEEIFKDVSLIRHFIRGFFDGDGCISYANKNHTMISASFVGTKMFLTKLLQYLPPKYSTVQLLSIKKCEEMYTISYAHKKAFELLYFMYKDSNIWLNRKKERFDCGCRLYEELYKLLQTNIGEPCDGNTEINLEINNSKSSYSVEIEPD